MCQQENIPISFQSIQESVQPKLLCLRDPLGGLLLRLFPKGICQPFLFALMLYGLVMIGGGSVISLFFTQRGIRFLAIFDSRELPIAVFAYLVTAPLVWLFYTWQPRGISGVFQQLYQNDVIGEIRSASYAQTVSKPINSFNRGYNLVVSLAAVAISLVIWLNAVYSPGNPFYLGDTTLWFLLSPLYFWMFWIPLVFVNVYILSWIVIRQVFATVTYTRLFRAFEIKPKLFHPDGCNGLASIGDYAIRSALLAVFLGFWLFVFTTYPMLFGQPINLKTDTILLLVAYIIAVPSLLLPPVWEAHNAMVEFKNKTLEGLAVQIRTMLSETSTNKTLSSKDLLQELERRYELLSREYHTWPFRPVAIKSFGISAITPLVSTGISYLIDLYIK